MGVCGDDPFAMYAAVCLYSVRQRVPADIAIDAYMLSPGLSEKSLKRLKRVTDLPGMCLHYDTYDPAMLEGLPCPTWSNLATHARLLLIERVGPEHSQVVYLDCDTLAVGDIMPLWDTPFDGAVLKASQDNSYPIFAKARSTEHFKAQGIDPASQYFGAGVIAFNLDAWREEKLLDRYWRVGREHGHAFTHADQDTLNLLCYGRYRWMEPKFNVVTSCYMDWDGVLQAEPEDVRVIHYTRHNPGHHRCVHPKREMWWAALRQSGWFSAAEYALFRLKFQAKRKIRRVR